MPPLDIVMPQERKPAIEPEEPQLDADALARQRALGDQLRALFDDVAKEPIPDEFLDLLRKMDESGQQGGEE